MSYNKNIVVVQPRPVRTKKNIFNKTVAIDDYVLKSQVGKGASGVVIKAYSKSKKEIFAIKIAKQLNSGEEQPKIEQLVNEVTILKSLSHPSIVQIKDYMTYQNNLYLVFPFSKSGDLFDCVSGWGRMTEFGSQKVFVQLLRAVTYLHENNIAHRDIKPENLLLDMETMEAKLCDFGLAVQLDSNNPITASAAGTIRCLPPEILAFSRSESSDESNSNNGFSSTIKIDPFAADIWACGVTYFFMLTGTFPFDDETDNKGQIKENILKQRYSVKPTHYMKQEAFDFIQKMLCVDPNQRPSAKELLESHYLQKMCQEI